MKKNILAGFLLATAFFALSAYSAENLAPNLKVGDMTHFTKEACVQFEYCGFAKVIDVGTSSVELKNIHAVSLKFVQVEKEGERFWINIDWLE